MATGFEYQETTTGREAQLVQLNHPPQKVKDHVDSQSAPTRLYDECYRVVNGVNGPIEFLWVAFDEPQVDEEGDGPFLCGEIKADMVIPL